MRILHRMTCLVVLLAALTVAAPVRGQQVETHTVQAGETLFSLSRQYDTTVDELRELNGLEGNTIRVGQTLIVGSRDESAPPAPSDDPSAEANNGTNAAASGRYTVREGDTFYTIGARYGIRPDTIFALNGRQTAPLEPGQTIRLPGMQEATVHRVRSGETLTRIAAQYNVNLQTLREENDLEGDQIFTGQELRIPSRTTRPTRTSGTLPPADTTGLVLDYPEAFAGRLTASGRPYDPERYTVSHASLPLGTVVLLTNPETDRRTFAEVTDRGPVDDTYLMEVSDAVAEQLGLEKGSEQPIEIRVMP